ncbi:pyridoxamine 5'-phosphate oxidase family protein [Tenacibaculum sp. TC6]|uniref:pyridoxamine 5'-phosphate oxidase family protein n=1 Tax=Tenacibaculum sp. TC6 TaxID=3423223 RepID=UPI003D362D80
MEEYTKSKLNRVKRGNKRAVYNIDEINSILDAGFIGYVSYIFEGNAIAIPMAYGRTNDKIYLHGSTGNRMLLSLLEQKSASMTVTHLDALILARSGFHHSVNYRSATLFGTVKKVDDPKEKEMALKCVMDFMMNDRWEYVREMNEKEFNQTLVIEITIQTASAKVRNVGVNDEPEDESLPIWAGIIPIKQIAEMPVPDEKMDKNIEIPNHVLEYYEKHK